MEDIFVPSASALAGLTPPGKGQAIFATGHSTLLTRSAETVHKASRREIGHAFSLPQLAHRATDFLLRENTI
jgi:hypothetical protein